MVNKGQILWAVMLAVLNVGAFIAVAGMFFVLVALITANGPIALYSAMLILVGALISYASARWFMAAA